MKHLLYAFALILCLCSIAYAEDSKPQAHTSKDVYQSVESGDVKSDATQLLVGRGCCSHHKGQCGCEGGRVVCCDGTLSPSCRCQSDEQLHLN